MPIIIPKSPIALAKISIIKIFTKSEGFAASAKAAADPTTPMARPQTKLLNPTVKPPPKSIKPPAKFLARISTS